MGHHRLHGQQRHLRQAQAGLILHPGRHAVTVWRGVHPGSAWGGHPAMLLLSQSARGRIRAGTSEGGHRTRRPRPVRSPVEERTSRPVRRVLLPPAVTGAAVAAIHLGPPLPVGSRDLPAGSGEQPSNACCTVLLRTGFAEPPQSPAVLVGSYPTVSPLPAGSPTGGLFSVALSRGSPRVAVSHRPALWSPDVPRPAGLPAVPRPPGRLVRAQHSTASPAPPQPVPPSSPTPPRTAPQSPSDTRPRRALRCPCAQ